MRAAAEVLCIATQAFTRMGEFADAAGARAG